jgi:uncharacterized membrane protein
MSLAITLHVLAFTLWVGGMFFAYMCLRPVAAEQLEPPLRLNLWAGVFKRFFPWVWLSVGTLLASGLWILFAVLGGMANAGLYVHLMLALGLVMMGIFGWVYFMPFARLKTAVDNRDWPAGGQQLAQIRRLVGINTILGVITIVVALAGRYWLN